MRHQLTSALLAGVCAVAIGATSGWAAEPGALNPTKTDHPTQPATGTDHPIKPASPGGPIPDNPKSIQESAVEKEKPAPAALTDQQRQAVLDAIAQRHSHQPTPKEFKPAVGVAVPPTVDIHAFPPTAVENAPALKQYMYAHLDREIAIVDAHEKKIVELIPLPNELVQTGGIDQKQAALSVVGGLGNLSGEQKRTIYQAASSAPQPVPGEPMLAGTPVPGSLALQPLPPELGSQIAQVQGFSVAKLQDGRVLIIDPHNRTIAGIITQDEGGRTAQDGAKPGAGQTMGASGGQTRDAIREREESGKESAYTGPTTTGPNTDK